MPAESLIFVAAVCGAFLAFMVTLAYAQRQTVGNGASRSRH